MKSKTIYLVRHGQYISSSNTTQEKLTPLGRKQANLTGKRLAQTKFGKFFCSTMPRARETADEIIKIVKFSKRVNYHEGLCELIPTIPASYKVKWKNLDKKQITQKRKLANKSIQEILKCQGKNILVVAHGNLIRYFVCKALEINPDHWLKMDIRQGSITALEITKERGTQLIALSDIGHMPEKLHTYF